MTSRHLARHTTGSLGAATLIALALIGVGPGRAAAASIALDVTGGGNAGTVCNPQVNPGCIVGWAFEVNSAIDVFSLGFFDVNSDGLTSSHDVGLFNSSGTLLASATVTNASTPVASASSAGRWLMANIAPIRLDPGTYTIGAFVLNQSPDSFLSSAPEVTIPTITYLGGRAEFSVASLVFPTSGPFQGFEPGLFGPTFTAQNVPEPATLVLLASGLVLAARGIRRLG
ncbi:MAG TPA: PEP-CTERM sorting domain-containing protein [Vicinamibacterales bacterium]|nr:PEP-CTERM sorting domain-containing protein [Vicinamibacterales bacterium]